MIEPRHRLDGHAPISAALGHRGGNRVVRADLDRVTRGTTAPSRPSIRMRVPLPRLRLTNKQDRPGAALSMAFSRLCAFETRVARPVNQPLQSAVAGEQPHSRRQEGSVVRVGLGIEQVDPGDIALATGRRVEASLRADPQCLRAIAARGQEAQQHVETDAMRADHHQVRGLDARPSGITFTFSPRSMYSCCLGMTMKPSARLNVVTEPDPFPSG